MLELSSIRAMVESLHPLPHQPKPAPALTGPALIELMEKHLTHLKKTGSKHGKPISQGSIECYQTRRTYIETFLTNHDDHSLLIPASCVDSRFFIDFETFSLNKAKKLTLRTINDTICYVKAVLRYGINTRQLPDMSHALLYQIRASEKTIPKPLTADQVKLLETTVFPANTRRQVDCFLFMVYTGFHISDARAVGPQHLQYSDKGDPYIVKERQKTGIMAIVPFWEKARQLVDKYGGLDKLPFASDTNITDHLREAARAVGIKLKLCPSMARDTFADDCTNRRMISNEALSKMLGHCDTQMVKKYSRVSLSRVEQEWKD